MCRYLTCLFLLCTCFSLHADAYRGFLHTKDDLHLTGYINFIQYRTNGLVIQFTNDFGDEYIIEPNRVAGFGFETDDRVLRYVSFYSEGRWLFLRVLERGRKLDLYQVPDDRSKWVDASSYQYLGSSLPDYWIRTRGGEMIPMYRTGFKRAMRALVSDSPELEEKIGSRGYRYKNLREIVAEYNRSSRRANRRL
ncbi:MAG: hypothetical protein AAFY36_16755 [Bacteroidota bacterium]